MQTAGLHGAILDLHRGRPLAAPRHDVEVGGEAAQQAAVQRRIARKGKRLPALLQRVVDARRRADELHPVAVQQHDLPVYAGKGRKRPGLGNRGHAHAPAKAVHARTLRPAGNLARAAAPFFHGLGAIWFRSKRCIDQKYKN